MSSKKNDEEMGENKTTTSINMDTPVVILNGGDGRKKSNETEPSETCYIHVSGMSCVRCINRIQDTLMKIEGILEVQVALLTEKAEVRYNPEYLIPSQIAVFIQQMGFGAKLLEGERSGERDGIETVELHIEGMTCASCVYKVERECKKLKGMIEARVTLLTSRGQFKYDKTTGLGTRDIINRLFLIIILFNY